MVSEEKDEETGIHHYSSSNDENNMISHQTQQEDAVARAKLKASRAPVARVFVQEEDFAATARPPILPALKNNDDIQQQPGAVAFPGPGGAHRRPLGEEELGRHVAEERTSSPPSTGDDVPHIPVAVLVPDTSESSEQEKNWCSGTTIPRRWIVFALVGLAALVAVIVGVVVGTSNAGGGGGEGGGEDDIPTTTEDTADVTVVIQLDDNPTETGWSLECNGTTLIDISPGTYENKANETISVMEDDLNIGEQCAFTITDSGDNGLEGGGYFEVYFGKDTMDSCSRLVGGTGDFTSFRNENFTVGDPIPDEERRPSNSVDVEKLPDEALDYRLVYHLNIPDRAYYDSEPPAYDSDYSSCETEFDQIAYYVELISPEYGTQWLWVSMDAFTNDTSKIGVPTFQSQALFQEGLSGMNIDSNIQGMEGKDFEGNIEFWPISYGRGNIAQVPGASDATFDFGDNPSGGRYGSMQIHVPDLNAPVQTLFAFNRWSLGDGGVVDLGIGNNPNPDGNPDWTFEQNGDSYSTKVLMIFVK